jgi:hypothetical protein
MFPNSVMKRKNVLIKGTVNGGRSNWNRLTSKYAMQSKGTSVWLFLCTRVCVSACVVCVWCVIAYGYTARTHLQPALFMNLKTCHLQSSEVGTVTMILPPTMQDYLANVNQGRMMQNMSP